MPKMGHLLLSVHIATFLTALPGNVLAFHALLRQVRRRHPTPADVLLLNLATSNLMFLLALLPFKLNEAAESDRLPCFPCTVASFLTCLAVCTGALFLAAVSVDRYLAVAFPLGYYVARRPRHAAMASVVLWAVSSLNLGVAYAIEWWINKGDGGDGAKKNNTTPVPLPPTTPRPSLTCYLNPNADQLGVLVRVRLEVFVVLFGLPLLVCCFCYVNVVLVWARLPNAGRRRRLRAVGQALGTLWVFALCLGPYGVCRVVGAVRQDDGSGWSEVALLAGSFNACLDLVVFYFSSAAVRSSLNSCFKRCLIRAAEAKPFITIR